MCHQRFRPVSAGKGTPRTIVLDSTATHARLWELNRKQDSSVGVSSTARAVCASILSCRDSESLGGRDSKMVRGRAGQLRVVRRRVPRATPASVGPGKSF